MQLIQGIATEVINKVKNAFGPAAILLKVQGRLIRIELPDEHLSAVSIRDGDRVVIAGDEEKGVFVASACKNLTEGAHTYRTPIRQEAVAGWFFFCFAAMAFGLIRGVSDNERLLYPMPAWLAVGMGLISALFGVICLVAIVRKLAAAFLVESAALETFIGTTTVLRPKSAGKYPQVEVQGHIFFLETSDRFIVENGDTLAVTIKKMPDGPTALTYRNVTRSLSGASSVEKGHVSAILFALICAGLVTKAAFDRPFHDAEDIFPLVLGAGILMLLVHLLISNFYRWRLDREAHRRTEEAARKFAPTS